MNLIDLLTSCFAPKESQESTHRPVFKLKKPSLDQDESKNDNEGLKEEKVVPKYNVIGAVEYHPPPPAVAIPAPSVSNKAVRPSAANAKAQERLKAPPVVLATTSPLLKEESKEEIAEEPAVSVLQAVPKEEASLPRYQHTGQTESDVAPHEKEEIKIDKRNNGDHKTCSAQETKLTDHERLEEDTALSAIPMLSIGNSDKPPEQSEKTVKESHVMGTIDHVHEPQTPSLTRVTNQECMAEIEAQGSAQKGNVAREELLVEKEEHVLQMPVRSEKKILFRMSQRLEQLYVERQVEAEMEKNVDGDEKDLADKLIDGWIEVAKKRIKDGIMVCHLVDYFEDAIVQQFVK